jgi:hypothetical protein
MGYLKMTGLKIGISRGLLNVSRNLRGATKTTDRGTLKKREKGAGFRCFWLG